VVFGVAPERRLPAARKILGWHSSCETRLKPVPETVELLFPFSKRMDRFVSRIGPQMHIINAQPLAARPVTTTPTTTLADQSPTKTDSFAVTHTFVTRGQASERARFVEEDSTDIFVLERCSPLNDF
jgi:hypothetical protein